MPQQGASGSWGAPKRRQWELGCPRSLRGSVTSGHFSAPGLTSRFCYLPSLISRGAPLICPFQGPCSQTSEALLAVR